MNQFLFNWRPTIALFGLWVGVTAYAGEPQLDINVNVAMTEDGHKFTPPTTAKPCYYYPIVIGYREEGEKVAGEKRPPTKPIVHQLAKALAQQNYIVVSPEHPQPALLLVFYWGYMNPEIAEFGTPGDDSQKVFFNQREMVALLGGQTLGNLDLDFEREAVMQGAEDNRYFVVVSAYDFTAIRQQHKKVLLWQARMSTPSGGVTMAEVIPTLITAGGPQFGHESIRPAWLTAPVAREGKVDVGTPTVKEYLEPKATTPTESAPKK